jgi:hypothetical protein
MLFLTDSFSNKGSVAMSSNGPVDPGLMPREVNDCCQNGELAYAKLKNGRRRAP